MENFEDLQSLLLNIIRQRGSGEGSAIKLKVLTERASIYFNRSIPPCTVRESIHLLRQRGYPICSSSLGFFWPASLEDIFSTVNRVFRSPARSELLTSRRMRDAGRRLFGGQMPLPEKDPLSVSTETDKSSSEGRE